LNSYGKYFEILLPEEMSYREFIYLAGIELTDEGKKIVETASNSDKYICVNVINVNCNYLENAILGLVL